MERGRKAAVAQSEAVGGEGSRASGPGGTMDRAGAERGDAVSLVREGSACTRVTAGRSWGPLEP